MFCANLHTFLSLEAYLHRLLPLSFLPFTGWEHPRPGHPHQSLYFTAYLPNNAEGQAVCGMLNRAFDARLLFPIGRSPFTGEDNQIVWNGVEHKVNRLGGPSK